MLGLYFPKAIRGWSFDVAIVKAAFRCTLEHATMLCLQYGTVRSAVRHS